MRYFCEIPNQCILQEILKWDASDGQFDSNSDPVLYFDHWHTVMIAGALRVTESIRGIEIDNSYDPGLHFDFRVSLKQMWPQCDIIDIDICWR